MGPPLRILLIAGPLFLYSLCFGQSDNIDSLNRVLPGLKGSARIDCLNALSSVHIYIPTDSAEIFAQGALKEAVKINYKEGIAAAWLNIAWSQALKGGDLRTMENQCRKTVLLLDKTGDKKLLAESWFALACALSSQCKFSFSLDAFDKAGQLYSSMGDEMGVARIYNYMGDDERNRGQYSKSLEYALKWLDIANKYNDQSYIDTWASLYAVVGDNETALAYYNQAKESARAAKRIDYELSYFSKMKGEIFLLQEKYDSAAYYFDLSTQEVPHSPPLNLQWGRLYLARKKYDSALLHLNNALTRSKNINDVALLQPVLLNLCKVYKETGNTEIAMQRARELLQITEKSGARQNARDGHLMLYQLFVQSGNKDSAFKHLQQYTILKDSIDNDLSAQKLAFYKIKSEKEKDQARIDLLNEEKKLQQQQLKQTTQQRKFLVMGIAGILLLGIFLLRNVILKRKNESNRRKIVENELQLQKLESEKTKVELQRQASELEMQALRAQMNPHFIFNSLNSINMFILENNKLQASEYLSKFSRLVRLILQNSHEAFIPLEKELEALQLYLELESLRFENKFEYKISVDDEVDTIMLKVPPLMIQPYAENAIWHGLMPKKEKGHLVVDICQQEKILFCKITDDGIGRKQALAMKSKSTLAKKSMGMRITADRIALLQQQNDKNTFISITDLVLPDGNPGGTEVKIKLPVHYD